MDKPPKLDEPEDSWDVLVSLNVHIYNGNICIKCGEKLTEISSTECVKDPTRKMKKGTNMKISGTITTLKARISASGDNVQTLTIEAHGDFSALHALMQKPLDIEIKEHESNPT